MAEKPEDDRSGFTRIRQFAQSDHLVAVVLRDLAAVMVGVAVLSLLLFTVSGVWPPMVAVESGSMEPELSRGDLVFTVEEHRYSPAFTYANTGVVTHQTGEQVGYRMLGGHGDVIVYRPNGAGGRTPVIHRARFWVNQSENWYDKADPAYVAGDSCPAVRNCPAPHAGFITKGDANSRYDQAAGLSEPVRPTWIRGTAELRIPYLGYIKLTSAVDTSHQPPEPRASPPVWGIVQI